MNVTNGAVGPGDRYPLLLIASHGRAAFAARSIFVYHRGMGRQTKAGESSRRLNRLTLAEATKAARLPEFIAQEEARLAGLPTADRGEFDEAVATLVRAPQSADQTSRSAVRGGSTEK